MNSDTRVKYAQAPKSEAEQLRLANPMKTHAGTIAVITKAMPMTTAADSSDRPEAIKAVEHAFI